MNLTSKPLHYSNFTKIEHWVWGGVGHHCRLSVSARVSRAQQSVQYSGGDWWGYNPIRDLTEENIFTYNLAYFKSSMTYDVTGITLHNERAFKKQSS